MPKSKEVAEYGDFQTPLPLAREVCALIKRRGLAPAVILEPTCGKGFFLQAALETFPGTQAVGLDINDSYIAEARRVAPSATLITADFFSTKWDELFRKHPEPLLLIGNPPWVTNAELGTLQSSNLPQKSNFKRLKGLDAITGKSNFDISEWMLIHHLESLNGKRSTVAVLCKTTVARKVLAYSWKHRIKIAKAEMYEIDAFKHFGAAVDACLFICDLREGEHAQECTVYKSIDGQEQKPTFGYREGRLTADVSAHDQLSHLKGESSYRWRSGIKHDCSKVMEFTKEGALYRNGLGVIVELEDTYLYPMLKSSELANGPTSAPKRWMLVTQRYVGQDTREIKDNAPLTWSYLESHAGLLSNRGSSIYKDRAAYSVFGVGEYTFTPWRVAISGFYKKLAFTALGSHEGKPIVLDDTSYFISCQSHQEAGFIASLLNSQLAQQFYLAYIFWDAKRPITVATLALLDIAALASELGCADELWGYTSRNRARTLF